MMENNKWVHELYARLKVALALGLNSSNQWKASVNIAGVMYGQSSVTHYTFM